MTNHLINIADRYRTFSDDDWAEILRKSGTHPEIDGVMFPDVPSDEFQRIFVGSTLSENVEEPLLYYKSIKSMYSAIGCEFGSKTRLLDVGSGWGRIIRFFLKDLSPKNLFGCDVSKDSITTCMNLFHGEVDFKLINPLPPSQYESDFFDIVEGYSVFSHLSLYAATLWMNEYCRILKPGGLLALTVWKRQRFDYIAGVQKEPITQKEKDSYMHMMQTSFSEQCSLEKMLYDATGVVYIPYSWDIDSTYGESFLSPEMLKEHWAPMFEHLDTVPLDVDQQIVFFRKKNEAKILCENFLHMLGKFALITDVQAICMHSYRKSNSIEQDK